MIPALLSIPGCALDSSEDGVDEGRAGDGNTGDNDTSEVDSDDLPHQDYSWEAQQLPTIEVACEALADINWMLKPPQPKGGGYKECRLPLWLQTWLEWVTGFLHVYMDTKSKYGQSSYGSQWMGSSLHCAHAQQSGLKWAINLWKWAKALIKDGDALPLSLTGTPHNCRIDDEDVATEIATHLQSLGLYILALDIINYTAMEVWA